MAARPLPALPDEIVEEILARVPPDDPARLVRAALACKRWCRLVAGPAFRRRFRELHPTPPVMGFIRGDIPDDDDEGTVRSVTFVPACRSFFRRPRADHRGWRVLDSRNGRVLLVSDLGSADPDAVLGLAVWDPVTDVLRELPPLPELPEIYTYDYNAAVLCAAATAGSCGHLDCRREPFLVVFVASTDVGGTLAYVYTSEADVWSEPTSSPHGPLIYVERPAHAGNALYFVYLDVNMIRILKYDLGTREMTAIHPPPMSMSSAIVLTTAEGGGLGCVIRNDSSLYLWSRRESGPNADMGWVQSRVIEIETLVPVGSLLSSCDVVSFANGGGVVYTRTVDASCVTDLKSASCYVTDLKSGCFRKVEVVNSRDNTIPYISFCIPALGVASTWEDQSAGA